MAWVTAHHVNRPAAADDLAVFAHALDASTDFHGTTILRLSFKAGGNDAVYTLRGGILKYPAINFLPLAEVAWMPTPFALPTVASAWLIRQREGGGQARVSGRTPLFVLLRTGGQYIGTAFGHGDRVFEMGARL